MGLVHQRDHDDCRSLLYQRRVVRVRGPNTHFQRQFREWENIFELLQLRLNKQHPKNNNDSK